MILFLSLVSAVYAIYSTFLLLISFFFHFKLFIIFLKKLIGYPYQVATTKQQQKKTALSWENER